MRYRLPSGAVLMILFAVSPASATQWGYPLTSLPEGWIATPEWSFGSEAYVDLYATAYEYGENDIHDAYIISDGITVPAATAGAVLEFDHEWLISAYNSTEYDDAYGHVSVLYSIDGDTQPFLLKYFDSAMGTPYNPEGSEHFSCSLAVSPGDTLRFIYHARVAASCWGATAGTVDLDWWVSDFLLTAYDGQALQPSTWADIKSSVSESGQPEEFEREPGGPGIRR